MAKPIELQGLPSADRPLEATEQSPERVLSIQLKDGVAFLPDVGEGNTTITYETDPKARERETKPWRKTLSMTMAPYWSGVRVQYETAQKQKVSAVIPLGHLKCFRLVP